MDKKIINKEDLFAQIKNLTTWGFSIGALITAANVFIDAHAALEVAPIPLPVPIVELSEIPFGATGRGRKMKLELAQLKKQITAAKAKEKPEKGCACLMPSEKAQVFVSDAEKYMEDAHDSMRSGNFKAVVSAWNNVHRDIRLANEALQECK